MSKAFFMGECGRVCSWLWVFLINHYHRYSNLCFY